MHFPPTPSHELDDVVAAKADMPSQLAEQLDRVKHTLDSISGRGPVQHLALICRHDGELRSFTDCDLDQATTMPTVVIDGENLSMAEIVAVSCFDVAVSISRAPSVQGRVDESVDFLTAHLAAGKTVYGINTGYGGSADTRSTDLFNMQLGLLQMQNSGVMLSSDIGRASPNFPELNSHALPRRVVRGSMLARCNSLLRGHSAVRLEVVQNIVELLNKDFIPIVPLRGSISASGDLMPLSYIAGALEGNTDIHLSCYVAKGKREILNAAEALQRAGIPSMIMRPKEGLGLINGTAVSCAAASLALHEAQHLALAAQVLTAMCTEALRGSADNYHPFISQVRPHRGQMHVAANIRRAVEGSRLVVGTDARHAGLYQDRYALRTSPQWLGPQLEDLMLAWEQVEVELNSTTDNPLVDAEQQHVHHGGNFQAVSITSAMEKTRMSLQMLGRLLFAQSSELINPGLNHVLTPNLCFDDPDISFTFKGVDINMAAYMSELAFLANPVSSHVQSAEMHNQAVNSLALISTRYTMDAVELVSLMTAAYLYALCQSLDLHALYLESFTQLEREGRKTFDALFSHCFEPLALADLWTLIVHAIRQGLISSKSKSTAERSRAAAEATILPLTKALLLAHRPDLNVITTWVDRLTTTIDTSIRTTRARFSSPQEGPTTLAFLGRGSKIMYRFVRETLGIPLHRGLVEHPTYAGHARDEIFTRDVEQEGEGDEEEAKKTTGSRITTIYEALREGRMNAVLVESLS